MFRALQDDNVNKIAVCETSIKAARSTALGYRFHNTLALR